MSVNKVILIGNVGDDPKIVNFDNGNSVANFPLATSTRAFKTKDGREVPETTEWHNLVVRGGLVGVVESYVNKGDRLYVEGSIKTRSWDKDGEKHYIVEIIVRDMQMLGGKPATSQQGSEDGDHEQQSEASGVGNGDGDGDDLPF